MVRISSYILLDSMKTNCHMAQIILFLNRAFMKSFDVNIIIFLEHKQNFTGNTFSLLKPQPRPYGF